MEATRLNAEGNGELYRKAEERAAEAARISCGEGAGGADGSPDPTVDLTGIPTSARLRSRAELKKLACPVLAFYAEKDLSVPAKLNRPAMRAALEASGNKFSQFLHRLDESCLVESHFLLRLYCLYFDTFAATTCSSHVISKTLSGWQETQ